jgi:hypothetical protein
MDIDTIADIPMDSGTERAVEQAIRVFGASTVARFGNRNFRSVPLGDIAALPRYFDRPGMAERRRAYHARVVASRQERLA